MSLKKSNAKQEFNAFPVFIKRDALKVKAVNDILNGYLIENEYNNIIINNCETQLVTMSETNYVYDESTLINSLKRINDMYINKINIINTNMEILKNISDAIVKHNSEIKKSIEEIKNKVDYGISSINHNAFILQFKTDNEKVLSEIQEKYNNIKILINNEKNKLIGSDFANYNDICTATYSDYINNINNLISTININKCNNNIRITFDDIENIDSFFINCKFVFLFNNQINIFYKMKNISFVNPDLCDYYSLIKVTGRSHITDHTVGRLYELTDYGNVLLNKISSIYYLHAKIVGLAYNEINLPDEYKRVLDTFLDEGLTRDFIYSQLISLNNSLANYYGHYNAAFIELNNNVLKNGKYERLLHDVVHFINNINRQYLILINRIKQNRTFLELYTDANQNKNNNVRLLEVLDNKIVEYLKSRETTISQLVEKNLHKSALVRNSSLANDVEKCLKTTDVPYNHNTKTVNPITIHYNEHILSNYPQFNKEKLKYYLSETDSAQLIINADEVKRGEIEAQKKNDNIRKRERDHDSDSRGRNDYRGSDDRDRYDRDRYDRDRYDRDRYDRDRYDRDRYDRDSNYSRSSSSSSKNYYINGGSYYYKYINAKNQYLSMKNNISL